MIKQKKIEEVIEFIRKAESLALRMNPDGFYVAFSGGKDSQVVLDLVKRSGVKYKAHMNMTSVDPPELIQFIRKNYPEVEMHIPVKPMKKLILENQILPMRQKRFCCQVLKERGGVGSVVITGIRRQESIKRKKRKSIELGQKKEFRNIQMTIVDDNTIQPENSPFDLFSMVNMSVINCVNGRDKVILNPILNWSLQEVWSYLKTNNIPHCSLYDIGFKRIGCILCPMSSVQNKQIEMERYPKLVKAVYLSAIAELQKMGRYTYFETPEEVLDWWMSNISFEEYKKQKQHKK